MSLKPSGGGFRFDACLMAGMLKASCVEEGASVMPKVAFKL